MINKMDAAYLNMQSKAKQFVRDLKEEERGASDIVAIIAIIVIVLAVAIVFRDQLKNVINSAFSTVSNWVSDPGHGNGI